MDGSEDSRASGSCDGGLRDVAPLRPGDHVVVIGAGPAGLTAAHLLAEDGVAVTVLEATGAVGGISRTEVYKGYRFDIGGHRFFTKIRRVEALWDELLGDEFLDVPRLSRILYRGRFFDYPLRARSALAGLGVWTSLRIVCSYAMARVRPIRPETNFEQWVTNRFGRRLYDIFFRTYTEKVWGVPCTEIRAEWAAQRIQDLSLGRAILDAASLSRRSAKIKSLITSFRYPRLGPGQMWEACRDRVVARGGRVLLEHRVTSVEIEDGVATGICAAGKDGGVRIAADHVISSMPLRHLVRATAPPDASEVRAAGEGLSYRDFLVVALMLDARDLFPDNWIYVHSPGVKVGRIQNFGNWSLDMVPNADTTCLGMEYFCFAGDDLWSAPDDELIALATREIDALGLARAGDVLDGRVIRVPQAYPVYDSRYREHLATVRAFLDPIPNLHCVGRGGMHKYNNQDHSMLTAMLTLENMRGARHDTWAVNTDFEYHETQKVGRGAREAAGVRPGSPSP